jgi:NADPH:quinone reductase-like Zn-dependent oxidoreductase
MEHAMRAAVVTDFRSPLQVQDLPIPEPGAGEVLVRIETSGLCHTDIHAAHGDWPVKPTPPFIPGHEGVGYVEKLGTGVSTRAIGDRVVNDVKDATSGKTVKQVQMTTVRLGDTRGDFVAITDGLKAGQLIATSGVFKLRNGSPVAIDNSLAPDAQAVPRPPNS